MKNENTTPNFDLAFDMTAFTTGITTNFKFLWDYVQNQTSDIQDLKKKLECL